MFKQEISAINPTDKEDKYQPGSSQWYQALYEILEYEFNDPKILLKAFTRKSAISEKIISTEIGNFESLEFLGDRVLNLIIASFLVKQNLDASPNELHNPYSNFTKNSDASKRNGGPLYRVANHLGLEKFIITGRSDNLELKSKRTNQNVARNKRKKTKEGILSDHMEALLGAMYLDCGEKIEIVAEFIKKNWQFLGLNEDNISVSEFGGSNESFPVHLLSEQQQRKMNAMLLSAAVNNEWPQAKLALKSGAQVETKHGDNQKTALHYFCEHGNEEAVAELLEEYHAYVDCQNQLGSTPLMFAVYHCKAEVVEFLLNDGAEVNIINNNGWTALKIAVAHGYRNIVEVILRESDEINDEQLIAAIDVAYKNNRSDIKIILEQQREKLQQEEQARIDWQLAEETQREFERIKQINLQEKRNAALFSAFTMNATKDEMVLAIKESLSSSVSFAPFSLQAIKRQKNKAALDGKKISYEQFNKNYDEINKGVIKVDVDKFIGAILEGADIKATNADGFTMWHLLGLILNNDKELELFILKNCKDLSGISLIDLPENKLIYRSYTELIDFNFSNANLPNIDFSNISLMRNVCFIGTNLTGAKFKNVQFENVDFNGAKLENVNFEEARFDRASFLSCLLTLNYPVIKQLNVKLNLHGIDLTKIDLTGIDASDYDLYNVKLDSTSFKSLLSSIRKRQSIERQRADENGKLPNYERRFLENVNLVEADLSGLDLSDISLQGIRVDKKSLESLIQLAKSGKAKLFGIKIATNDLKDVDFSGLDLAGIDFSCADLSGAKLSNCSFKDANLMLVNFADADLTNATFAGAYLSSKTLASLVTKLRKNEVDLRGAIIRAATIHTVLNNTPTELSHLDLSDTNLQGVSFEGITLNYINFEKANLADANFNLAKMNYVNLSSANLSGSIFKPGSIEYSNLFKIDLSNAQINLLVLGLLEKGAILLNTSLIGCKIDKNKFIALLPLIKQKQINLDGLMLQDADLSGIDLSGFCLDKIQMIDVNLKNANLTGASLQATKLKNVKFDGANLVQVQFSGCYFKNVSFIDADLSQVNMPGVTLETQTLVSLIKQAKNFVVNFSGVVLTDTSQFFPAKANSVQGYFRHLKFKVNLKQVDLSGLIFQDVEIDRQVFIEILPQLKARKLSMKGLFLNFNLKGIDLAQLDFNGVTVVNEAFKSLLNGEVTTKFTTLKLIGMKIARGTDLRSYDLTKINMLGIDITGCYLNRKNVEALLAQANGNPINLSEVNLGNADLSNLNLMRADLTKTDLTGVNFAGTNLDYANLVDIVTTYFPDKKQLINLQDASLIQTNVTGLDLHKTKNLSEQQLSQAINIDKTKGNQELVTNAMKYAQKNSGAIILDESIINDFHNFSLNLARQRNQAELLKKRGFYKDNTPDKKEKPPEKDLAPAPVYTYKH